VTDPILTHPLSRRALLRTAAAAGAATAVGPLSPASARAAAPATEGLRPAEPTVDGVRAYDLTISESDLRLEGRAARAVTINGSIPGPLLRFREGEEAVMRVRNDLAEDTSIHWHGLLLPPGMDGVPGLSFDGIRPGSVFEYRFPIKQAGTYWYHSHSGLQEQLGHYGPLVIDPLEPYGHAYDREFVLVLSDWTFEDPYRVLSRLKKQPDAYNYQRRTIVDLVRDVARDGFGPTMRDRLMWSGMRMNPTDIADVTGATYSYLLNGAAPEDNWTGLFRPGERVLLRVINAAAGSYFDVRIPGASMTVLQASGQPVEPVETDEFRIALAETYDVLVTLRSNVFNMGPAGTGLYVDNFDAGNPGDPAFVGTYTFDFDTPDATTANVFNGGNEGIHMEGEGLFLVNDTFGFTVFNGTVNNYITLTNGALYQPGLPTLISIANVNFDGLILGPTPSNAQKAIIEARVTHFLDHPPNEAGLFFELIPVNEATQLPEIPNFNLPQWDPNRVFEVKWFEPFKTSFKWLSGGPYNFGTFELDFPLGTVDPNSLSSLGELAPAAGPGSEQAKQLETCTQNFMGNFWAWYQQCGQGAQQ